MLQSMLFLILVKQLPYPNQGAQSRLWIMSYTSYHHILGLVKVVSREEAIKRQLSAFWQYLSILVTEMKGMENVVLHFRFSEILFGRVG